MDSEFKKFVRIASFTLIGEFLVLFLIGKLFAWAGEELRAILAFALPSAAIISFSLLGKVKWIPAQSAFINAYLFYVIEKLGVSTFRFLRNLSVLSMASGTYLFVILHQKEIVEGHWDFTDFEGVRGVLTEISRLFGIWPGFGEWPYAVLILLMAFSPLIKRISSVIRTHSGITLITILLCFCILAAWPPGSTVSGEDMAMRIAPLLAGPIIILFPIWVSKLQPVEEGAADRKFIENYIHRDFEPRKGPAVWSIQWFFFGFIENILLIKDKKYGLGFSELFRVYNLWNARRDEARRITTDNIRYLDDFPIQRGEDDELGNKRISYELFKRIRSTSLEEAEGSIVIGLEGKRGTGKTSILNILKNDYIRFGKANLSYLKFMAWTYPSGRLLEAFLSDFAKHCENQGINVGEDLEKYSKSLSEAHWGFKAVESFVEKKTFSEKMETISDRLKRAGKKIVVALDDLDRLSRPQDFEAVLKLLRSVADFPGVIYIVCYSEADMAKRGSQWKNLMDDFGEKFLNWKLTTSALPLSEQNALTEYLQKHLIDEARGILKDTIESNAGILDGAWAKVENEIAPEKWISPDRLADFVKLRDIGSAAAFEKYVISAVEQRIADLRFGHHEFATPRFVKSFINETLMPLSDTGAVIELFLSDINWITYQSQKDAGRYGVFYEEWGVEKINSLYQLLCKSWQQD